MCRSDLLPLIHFCLLGYSKRVHDSLAAKGYDLFAKTDMRFLEVVYKLLREEFGYQPQVCQPVRDCQPIAACLPRRGRRRGRARDRDSVVRSRLHGKRLTTACGRCAWQLRMEQFFAEGFVERKVILVHDIMKLCQRCHADLQRKLKASQRDNATARAFAVHSGSGVSSLASSSSHKPARPLVQRGTPAGGKRLVVSAHTRALRGSGGLLGHEPQDALQAPNSDTLHVEYENNGRLEHAMRPPEPRALRPPAPHPITGAQSARTAAPLQMDWSDSQQAGMPERGGRGEGGRVGERVCACVHICTGWVCICTDKDTHRQRHANTYTQARTRTHAHTHAHTNAHTSLTHIHSQVLTRTRACGVFLSECVRVCCVGMCACMLPRRIRNVYL